MTGERGLTERQRRFVDAYAATGNGTEAAIQAGYANGDRNNARVSASRDLLPNPNVQAALAERLASWGITQEKIARQMWSYATDDDSKVRSSSVRAAELTARMAGMLTPDTNVSVDARSVVLPSTLTSLEPEQLLSLLAGLTQAEASLPDGDSPTA